MQAILSKMIVQEGHLKVGGTIAYVPQSPWVQNLSLRDNILFGMPYDEEKYKAVIHACALELDLKILTNGMAVEGLGRDVATCHWHAVYTCDCHCNCSSQQPHAQPCRFPPGMAATAVDRVCC